MIAILIVMIIDIIIVTIIVMSIVIVIVMIIVIAGLASTQLSAGSFWMNSTYISDLVSRQDCCVELRIFGASG